MQRMDLRRSFERWLSAETGSSAVPALRRHLKDLGYRLFSCVEHAGRHQHEIYHPERGFFRANGDSEQEALLGIMRQIWLMDSIAGAPAPEVGPTPER